MGGLRRVVEEGLAEVGGVVAAEVGKQLVRGGQQVVGGGPARLGVVRLGEAAQDAKVVPLAVVGDEGGRAHEVTEVVPDGGHGPGLVEVRRRIQATHRPERLTLVGRQVLGQPHEFGKPVDDLSVAHLQASDLGDAAVARVGTRGLEVAHHVLGEERLGRRWAGRDL